MFERYDAVWASYLQVMAKQGFQINTTVRTISELTRKDFLGPTDYKRARRSNTPGRVTGTLAAWYLVLHEDNKTAIYIEDELQLEPGYWQVTHVVQGTPYLKEIATYDEVETYVAELAADGHGVTTSVEGPFYSDKVLSEGPQDPKTLFDYLTDDQ